MAEQRYYMACIDLTGRSVLVVGGGRVALEKVEGLLDSGAEVTVVAPQIVPELAGARCHARSARLPHRGSRRPLPRDRRNLDDVGEPARLPRRRGSQSSCATSSTCPSCARSSFPPCTARARSRSPSRPAAPPPRSRSGYATRSQPSSGRSMPTSRTGCASCGPWAKSHLATYEERKEYFAGLVSEALG